MKTPHRQKNPRSSVLSLALRPFNLRLDNSAEQDIRIEIVPLIDVIFCILVFFLLAAVGFSRQRAMNLDLPKANTGEAQMRKMVIVSLDYAGQVYIEQQPVADSQLYQAVESYFQRQPDALMALYASKDVRYDRVIQVLDVLRQVGGERVALATLPDAAEQPLKPTNPPGTFPGTLPTTPSLPTPGNNPLGSFGTPSLPGSSPLPNASPVLPSVPGSGAAQPSLPTIPQVPAPAPTSPALPDTPERSSTGTSEQ